MEDLEETKVKPGRQKRIDITDSLKEKLTRAKSVVVTDYRGLNMTQLGELRGELLKENAEYTVAKNRLVVRAAKAAGYETADELTGPTAVLFAYGDEISPIKALANFIKTNKLPEIKLGYLNQEMLTELQITQLAKLPSRDELIGKVVGGIASPLYGVVGVLQANLRNLVYTLNSIKDSKGGV
jgi:large subunit ribosomal protein L10